MSARCQILAELYDEARPRLVGVAYAILGSYAEAEDIVSECWMRLVEADAGQPVLDVEGWSIVAVSRAAIDVLRSAHHRRESYPGSWLPEPVVDAADPDPADRVTLDDRLRYALLVVLESLSPAERTAWVLHDLFELTFADVARVVGRSPAAVRQLAARARRHVAERAPRFDIAPAEHRAVVERFLAAATGGSLADLVRYLDPDVVLTSDGGGEVSAVRRPVVGADRVARFLVGIAGRVRPDERVVVVSVNGAPGLAVFRAAALTDVIALTVSGGLVSRVDFVRAPAKLERAWRSGAAS
ncbi:RNA polymerase, sigma-24 subunit, ECF subfamily [Beutenbergia cavernae DSM 12333]|uniref:RNA polymerase, sigma-24 subunit, ECF subfamily n=1 Tax=Beutenbergia cavernae (strain ATCC BAA-8 / DSM 12333 / CCUG 43141 / JCM 11478 / NBRC 16432 / NCIMB 13614 / HKI 0122) TaxID=471853 RepID=C5BZT9_BEUC1|nr:RNA polymerase sigma factor SigJ [Beutenbergia cavernae]ACQ81269.1 RNA polymerase, sigma-24 subunit, ECF subfamily [Beutenbergia cavernae DSM 12333]